MYSGGCKNHRQDPAQLLQSPEGELGVRTCFNHARQTANPFEHTRSTPPLGHIRPSLVRASLVYPGNARLWFRSRLKRRVNCTKLGSNPSWVQIYDLSAVYQTWPLSHSQLFREVRIMKLLNHPNIGELYVLTRWLVQAWISHFPTEGFFFFLSSCINVSCE